ncbi:MAG: helix-turn-helix domain-containing protein [Ruminococcaceae bacterium]|nr:helix-turn-helix domain-containing protein [Oscillospiraceae bacterium]
MSNSLCQFMPETDFSESISVINFVYETEFHKLTQPFFNLPYRLHLVLQGEAVLHVGGLDFPLRKGCVFIIFSGFLYTIDGSDDFEYMYITFSGQSVLPLFENFHITQDSPVYYNMDSHIDFWFSSIRRITPQNSNLLTKSVLFYTLSFLQDELKEITDTAPVKSVFDTIVDYIGIHCTESDLSLKKVAAIFSYTPKYLSSLLRKNGGDGFKEFLTRKRIEYALHLIDEEKITFVTEIAHRSGYTDPLYFSKVFKKATFLSPTDYIEQHIF